MINFRELAPWKAAGLPDLSESNSAKNAKKIFDERVQLMQFLSQKKFFLLIHPMKWEKFTNWTFKIACTYIQQTSPKGMQASHSSQNEKVYDCNFAQSKTLMLFERDSMRAAHNSQGLLPS